MKKSFERGTYGLAAFSIHAFELLQLVLQGAIPFAGSAHNALCGLFVVGPVVGLGIRARPFENASGDTGRGRMPTVAH